MKLRREDAAKYLGIERQTLDNWRSSGRGPRFYKIGARVLYEQSDLDDFLRERLFVATGRRASEQGAAA